MRFRFALSASLALLGTCGFAQDLKQRISFSAPATRAAVLFPALGKQMGLELGTVPGTEDEVILIDVHDVTVKELMNQIAKAANAEWKHDRKVYRLIRPDRLSLKASVKESEERTALYQRFLNLQSERLRAVPAWSSEQAKALAKALHDSENDSLGGKGPPRRSPKGALSIADQTPATTAVHELLQQLGAEQLARLNPRQRIVFALHPTSMQLTLGGESARIFEEFVRNQREYAEAVSDGSPVNSVQRMSFQLGQTPVLEPGNPALGIGQAIMVIDQHGAQMAGPGVAMQVKLTVADTTGAPLASATVNVFQPIPEDVADPTPEGTNPVGIDKSGQEFAKLFARPLRVNVMVMQGRSVDRSATMYVRLPGVAESVGFYRAVSRPRATAPMSPELRNRLLHPEAYDPLAYVAGDALKASASALHLNLVADLPDSCFQAFCQMFESPAATAGATDLLKITCHEAGLRVDQTGSWAVISPTNPEEAAALRVNRVGLGKLLRSIDAAKSVNLDDLAAYVSQQEKDVTDVGIDGKYLQIVSGPLGRQAITMTQNPNALKIYGARTPSQRAAIAANGAVTLDSLTAEQKRWLVEDVFNSIDGPHRIAEAPRGPRIDDRRGDIKSERTQMLPGGIRLDGHLSFKVSTEKGFNGQDPETSTATFLSTPEIAASLFQKEMPALGPPVDYKTYQAASRSTITLQFELAAGITLTRTLEDTEIDRDSQAVSYDNIASDSKKEIDDYLQRIRSVLKGMTIGSTTPPRRISPPP